MSEIQKTKIRKRIIKSRQLIENRNLKENKIKEKLIQLINANNVIVSSYFPINHEVNINNFAKYFLRKRQRIVLPVIDKLNSHLLFKEWRIKDNLIKGKYGIMTPSNNIFLSPKILLIPMVAFDINKNRLGYGGGYYDRTIFHLEKKSKILKFGIAFDEQETKKVPTLNFDKKMDLIVTQSRIII